MKVTYSIDKEYIFAAQVDLAKQMIKEAKEQNLFSDDMIESMANCYSENEYEAQALKVDVLICNKGLSLDYYVNMKIWGFSKCFEVGFYLSDFYEHTSDNTAYILACAYRRVFNAE